jgi:cell division septation protein DedD
MLKRFLPLLFVILVTLAVVFLFLLFRGPGPAARSDEAPAEPPAASDARAPAARRPAVVATAEDGVREFEVTSESDYLMALEALGTSPEDIEAWARSRGFPPATFTAAAGMPLPQPYRSYDEDTLRGLAEGGDLWAMQFLAADLASSRPLEAADWYREAAVRGSAFAARELGGLLHDVDRALAGGRQRWSEGTLAAATRLAESEAPLEATALAWLMAAESDASLPPGAFSRTQAGFTGRSPDVEEACRRAASILADLAAERDSRGVELPPRRPPPFAVELPPEETADYCRAELLPPPDWTGCETVRLVSATGSVTAHRCPR